MATLIRTAAQILADIAASGGDVPDDPPPPTGRRSDGGVARVRELAAAGLTDRLIAARIGVSREAVRRMRYRHGIPPGRTVRGRHTAAPDPDARGGGR